MILKCLLCVLQKDRNYAIKTYLTFKLLFITTKTSSSMFCFVHSFHSSTPNKRISLKTKNKIKKMN